MKNNRRTITAALVGDPNTGKSTFFNAWTGMHQVTGNWPGVTVEKLVGEIDFSTNERLVLVDLPGIYSLHAVSEDERVAADYARSGEPDIIINIVDAVNLERNLYLTTALAELGKPMVMVLSMTDILERQGRKVNMAKLSERLGMPVVSANLKRRSARVALERAVIEALSAKQKRVCAEYPASLNEAMKQASREGEPEVNTIHRLEGILPGAETVIDDFSKAIGTTPDVLIADARYAKIAEVTDGVVNVVGHARTQFGLFIDRVVLNRFLSVPIFLGIMYLLFWFTQVLGAFFIDFFDGIGDAFFVTGLGNVLTMWGAPAWLITLLADGFGVGIQTVLTFVPPVFFIYLGLSILEDSGYMARAAYVMDRFMRMLGLPGSAFVPMLVGFGCTVPAIMATRTLPNRRDRLLTVFMAPFMSCGARLPVYALFGAAFFGAASGTVVFLIYLCGIALAVVTGVLLKHTLFVGDPAPFVMELPLYHIPRPLTVLKQAWERLSRFVFRAGQVLVVMVLLLNVCNTIQVKNPWADKQTPAVTEAQPAAEAVDEETVPASDATAGAPTISVVEVIGRTMAPIFVPMGVGEDNWQGSVALIVGLFAKEQVVTSLNTLYGVEEAEAADRGEVTRAAAWDEFRQGLKDAFATIPEAFADTFGSLLDPLGISGSLASDYEPIVAVAEKLAAEDLPADRIAVLSAQLAAAMETLDLAGLKTARAEAVAALAAAEKVGAGIDDAKAALDETDGALEPVAALQQLVDRMATDRIAAARELKLAAEKLHSAVLAEGAEGSESLMDTLTAKFEHSRHRAFAFLLFVLLYVPCLAAMAAVVREIGWGYGSILFGYLTLLGWCVATLYFQIVSEHNIVWIVVPCAILAGIAAFFTFIGRRYKVKLVV